MKKVNYAVCVKNMMYFLNFTHYGNNMSGILKPDQEIQLIKYYKYDYAIYSYKTLICFVNFTDRTYCINPKKYSSTTSKQVTYIRRAAKNWEHEGFERILWI